MTDTDTTEAPAAGAYELTGDWKRKLNVDKPFEPPLFKRFKKGEIVVLDAAEAARLVPVGGAVKPGDAARKRATLLRQQADAARKEAEAIEAEADAATEKHAAEAAAAAEKAATEAAEKLAAAQTTLGTALDAATAPPAAPATS